MVFLTSCTFGIGVLLHLGFALLVLKFGLFIIALLLGHGLVLLWPLVNVRLRERCCKFVPFLGEPCISVWLGNCRNCFLLGSVGMILAQALYKQKGKMKEKCYVSLLSVTCCTGCKTSCQLDCGGLWSLGKGFCSGISPGTYKYVFPLYLYI
jgi:hypothetical protein